MFQNLLEEKAKELERILSLLSILQLFSLLLTPNFAASNLRGRISLSQKSKLQPIILAMV
jgi:hypothetical protein